MNMGAIESLFATSEPAGLGPQQRSGVWEVDQATGQAVSFCATAKLEGGFAVSLQALVLLWHDHLDEAHGLVQDLAGAEPAWVHGIMHRREPDYSNARYWFHRVGVHPAFEPLADVAAPVLAAHPALPHRLIRDGRWDPFAFVEAVSASLRVPGGGPEVPLLRELQRMETLALAQYLAAC